MSITDIRILINLFFILHDIPNRFLIFVAFQVYTHYKVASRMVRRLILSIFLVLHNAHFVLQTLSNDLTRPPDTLEDLKFVLGVIAKIKDIQLNVEFRIFDILERYRTLQMYSIEVCSTADCITVNKCLSVL